MTGRDGWANRYGWAVNHVWALMIQIVSNDTFKKQQAQINTKRPAATHDRCPLLVSYGNSLFRPITEQFKWRQLVNLQLRNKLWNFRTKELSQERKFHRWNFRCLEPSFSGTLVPWNFRSLALSSPGVTLTWNFRSWTLRLLFYTS